MDGFSSEDDPFPDHMQKPRSKAGRPERHGRRSAGKKSSPAKSAPEKNGRSHRRDKGAADDTHDLFVALEKIGQAADRDIRVEYERRAGRRRERLLEENRQHKQVSSRRLLQDDMACDLAPWAPATTPTPATSPATPSGWRRTATASVCAAAW